jgi:hypothetical protein
VSLLARGVSLEKNAAQFFLISASAAALLNDGDALAVALAVVLGELGGGVAPDIFPLLQDVSARPTTRIAAAQDLVIEFPFSHRRPTRRVASNVRRRAIVNSVIHIMFAATLED